MKELVPLLRIDLYRSEPVLEEEEDEKRRERQRERKSGLRRFQKRESFLALVSLSNFSFLFL